MNKKTWWIIKSYQIFW